MPLSTDNFFEISLNARLKKHTTDTATTQGFKIKKGASSSKGLKNTNTHVYMSETEREREREWEE